MPSRHAKSKDNALIAIMVVLLFLLDLTVILLAVYFSPHGKVAHVTNTTNSTVTASNSTSSNEGGSEWVPPIYPSEDEWSSSSEDEWLLLPIIMQVPSKSIVLQLLW